MKELMQILGQICLGILDGIAIGILAWLLLMMVYLLFFVRASHADEIKSRDSQTAAGTYLPCPCPVPPQKQNIYDIADLSFFLNQQKQIKRP